MGNSFEELLNKETPAEDSICEIVLEVIKLRKLKGLSQHDLAQKAEVGITDVMYLETFSLERVKLSALSKILEALGLKLKIAEKEGC